MAFFTFWGGWAFRGVLAFSQSWLREKIFMVKGRCWAC